MENCVDWDVGDWDFGDVDLNIPITFYYCL